MHAYQLGVIGGGTMAEAILAAAIRSDALAAGDILVADASVQRREQLSESLGLACTADNAAAAACEKLLLAVKPQQLCDAIAPAAEAITPDCLVVSIMAGVDTARLDELTGGRARIVRAMPNTPLLVGAGAAGLCAGPRATREDVDWARSLLICGGGLAVVVDEDHMDALTAVSGSGPAYAFYLIEAMVAAGQAEGLTESAALALATQTLAGAARLLAAGDVPPAELRRRVTSPGGTTQAAIETLDAHHVRDHLTQAVRAAAARSRQLRQES